MVNPKVKGQVAVVLTGRAVVTDTLQKIATEAFAGHTAADRHRIAAENRAAPATTDRPATPEF
ncbi:hypothetical protein [Mycobacterium syngnathidarum]|uniref:hypothetical protein n=1 Tax=Mycobacterium syngnathidarum TaxID=1908205 RepID=UPI001041D01B|nr:hypothetical protein [Mycobacterium syngnathidarum]